MKPLPEMRLEMTDASRACLSWRDDTFKYHTWFQWSNTKQRWCRQSAFYKNDLVPVKVRGITRSARTLEFSAAANAALNSAVQAIFDKTDFEDLSRTFTDNAEAAHQRNIHARWLKSLKEAFATIKTAPQAAVDEAFAGYDKEYQAALILIRQHGGTTP